MNIYDYLKNDHQCIRNLFQQLNQANNENNIAKKQQLVAELSSLLAKHSQLEIETIYNVLHECQEFNEETQAISEHQEVTEILSEFATIGLDQDKWNKYINVLQEKVCQHIDHEEKVLFPEVRKLATPHLSRELNKQINLVDKNVRV